MTFTVLIKHYRKAGVTPAEFRAGCEDVLIPLLKEITGKTFPTSHTRHYIDRTDAPKADTHTERNPTTPATAFVGSQEEADWDCIATLVFESKDAFTAYVQTLMDPANGAKIQEAEGQFVDAARSSVVLVSEAVVTTN